MMADSTIDRGRLCGHIKLEFPRPLSRDSTQEVTGRDWSKPTVDRPTTCGDMCACISRDDLQRARRRWPWSSTKFINQNGLWRAAIRSRKARDCDEAKVKQRCNLTLSYTEWFVVMGHRTITMRRVSWNWCDCHLKT